MLIFLFKCYYFITLLRMPAFSCYYLKVRKFANSKDIVRGINVKLMSYIWFTEAKLQGRVSQQQCIYCTTYVSFPRLPQICGTSDVWFNPLASRNITRPTRAPSSTKQTKSRTDVAAKYREKSYYKCVFM